MSIALLTGVAVPLPEDLPAVTFGQSALYRLELALLVFYGALLLITPAFSGLIRGRLPVEISTQGAKFAGESDESADAVRATLEKLAQTTGELQDGLTAANLRLQEIEDKHA